MMDMKTLGERIKRAREERRLTQKQLGEMVGIDQAHISRLERGEKGMAIDSLAAIAKALHVSLSDIMEDAKEGADAARTRDGISDEAMEFAKAFDSLPPNQRAALRQVAKALVDAAEEQRGVKGG
ncbi:helix-turn-helix domain-containing protein [Methylogaea oryzae]|nr:helix-turn-helix transcriptional regulator [Methylogaea oryzae]